MNLLLLLLKSTDILTNTVVLPFALGIILGPAGAKFLDVVDWGGKHKGQASDIAYVYFPPSGVKLPLYH